MQDPIILDLLSYWESLRGDRVAPTRSELDPRKISGALSHTFVLEYKDERDVRFRLAGSKICDLMGMELRGMPAHALIEIGHRETLAQIMVDLVTDPKIIELQLQHQKNNAKVTARMLMLPMQDQHGKIARILGCVVARGATANHPQRFEIEKVKTTRIVGAMSQPPAGAVAGFAEDTQAFEGLKSVIKPKKPTSKPSQKSERLITGKPYLRLVKDD